MSGLDLLFKHIFDRPTPELLNTILESLAANSGDVQYYALQYMASRFDIEKQQLIDNALKYLQPEKVMTVAEQLKEEGMEKKAEMIARNALQKGADVEFVAGITELTLEQVKHIQAELTDQ